MRDLENILYKQSVEKKLNNGKDGKTRTIVEVTKELNCLLVWRTDVVWEYPHAEDVCEEQVIIKSFNLYDKSTAIEYAVDWIRTFDKPPAPN